MHGVKEDTQKSSSSWLDLCNNGDYSIPPTGLEFHNTQLLPGHVSQQSAAPFSSQTPQSPRTQEVVNKPGQKEMVKCSNNPIASIYSLPQSAPSMMGGAQGSRGHKRPTYDDNSSTHYYTGPHYSHLAAAASSNYNRNSRYSYYQQHHHTYSRYRNKEV